MRNLPSPSRLCRNSWRRWEETSAVRLHWQSWAVLVNAFRSVPSVFTLFPSPSFYGKSLTAFKMQRRTQRPSRSSAQESRDWDVNPDFSNSQAHIYSPAAWLCWSIRNNWRSRLQRLGDSKASPFIPKPTASPTHAPRQRPWGLWYPHASSLHPLQTWTCFITKDSSQSSSRVCRSAAHHRDK